MNITEGKRNDRSIINSTDTGKYVSEGNGNSKGRPNGGQSDMC